MSDALQDAERRVHEELEKLGIPFTRYPHPPVFTVSEAAAHWASIPATHCKNLFLRNKKGTRHYLVIARHDAPVDIATLTRRLGADRLSFGSAERLLRHLGLEPGSVSPFGLLNDEAHQVIVVIDDGLRGANLVGFHPNTNTATITLTFSDFERFVEHCGNPFRFLELSS
jgi:Ala-tRNA(Pro) deacylase